jgi:hypothetical protein
LRVDNPKLIAANRISYNFNASPHPAYIETTTYTMKNNLDFSEGIKGKFFTPGATLNLPIYLDRSNLSFVREIAKKKGSDVSSVVNDLIRTDRQLVRVIE